MTNLRDIQRAMQQSVLVCDAKPALAIVADSQGATARDRLHVYIHAYRARLAEVLGNDFGGTLAMIGEKRFGELAQAYIRAHPSREFNARWYGEAFPHFLSTTPQASENPAIGEMAKLDWGIGLSFDAPDEPSVGPKELEGLAPELWPHMRFRLHRSVQRLRFEFNVAMIRRAADRRDPIPEAARLAASQGWVVSRMDGRIFHREISDDENAALAVTASGGSFADVCDELCLWHDASDVAMRAVTLLRDWIDSGWLADLVVESGTSPVSDFN